MNRSGQSVRAVTDWYKIEPQSVLVIYDDMDLPVGRLRIRLSGSAGGHNGMKSIISHLGAKEFPRLRIGIGKSDGTKGTISHVLGKFSPAESKTIEEVLYVSLKAISVRIQSQRKFREIDESLQRIFCYRVKSLWGYGQKKDPSYQTGG